MSLALLAGEGNLPFYLLKNLPKNEGAITIDLIPNRTIDLEKYSNKYYHLPIYEALNILEILKKNNIDRVVFAGKINKQTIFNATNMSHFDNLAINLLDTSNNKRDNTIMLSIINLLEKNNIRVEKQSKFLKSLMARKKVYTKRIPSEKELDNIRYGFTIAKKMGKLDIGQTVIVKEKTIMAVEAIEGTDAAIERGGSLGCSDTIVIKVAKINQDERFDIPTVGLSTLMVMHKVKSFILAIEARKTFMIDEDNMRDFANKNNMVIMAL